MIDRTFGFLLTFVGVVAVVFLACLLVDLHRASSKGPRWKQRLLAAGMSFLLAIGAGGLVGLWPRAAAAEMTIAKARKGPKLEKRAEWQRIEQTLVGVEGLVGKVEATEQDVKQLEAELLECRQALKSLQKVRVLNKAESALVAEELDRAKAKLGNVLRKGSDQKQPRTMCYKPAPFARGRRTMDQLEAQVDLLVKIQAAGRIQEAVVCKRAKEFETSLAAFAEVDFDRAPKNRRKQILQRAAGIRKKIDKLERGRMKKAGCIAEAIALHKRDTRTETGKWVNVMKGLRDEYRKLRKLKQDRRSGGEPCPYRDLRQAKRIAEEFDSLDKPRVGSAKVDKAYSGASMMSKKLKEAVAEFEKSCMR